MTAPIDNTPRTLALALALWGLAVAAGSLAGVFAKLPDEEVAAIAGFGFVFALAAIYLDPAIREFLAAVRTSALVTIAIEANLAIALALMLATGFAEGAVAAALERFLAGMAILFLAPLSGAVHVAIAERLVKPRPARGSFVAKRGATPAAS